MSDGEGEEDDHIKSIHVGDKGVGSNPSRREIYELLGDLRIGAGIAYRGSFQLSSFH